MKKRRNQNQTPTQPQKANVEVVIYQWKKKVWFLKKSLLKSLNIVNSNNKTNSHSYRGNKKKKKNLEPTTQQIKI